MLTGIAPVCCEAAVKKLTAPEALNLAEAAFYDYDVEAARTNLSAARTAIKKLKKAAAEPLTAQAEEIEQRVDRLESMMQRVEKIEIIDSLTVDREDFFETYRLSRGAGGIYSPMTLPENCEAVDSTIVYVPENGSTMIWGGVDGLMSSERFTDGTWDTPFELGDHLNRGGVANYPFLMSDGITLYYATEGEDGLGGYDIYFSRKDDDGQFLTPQNIGMPYNSPYDDFLLAIDEVTGVGWWATDRNQIPGKVTIYVFVPSEMRVNYPVDDAELANRASLRNWRETLLPSTDVESIMKRLDAAEMAAADVSPDFVLPLPNGSVYTHWSDFKSGNARRLMEQYVDALEEDAADRRMLEDLRLKFRPGNKKSAEKIVSLEKKTEASVAVLKAMVNKVIEAELPANKRI